MLNNERIPLSDLNEDEEVVTGSDIEDRDYERERSTSIVSTNSAASFPNPLIK